MPQSPKPHGPAGSDGPDGVDRVEAPRRVRLAAGVLNQTPLDWDGNARRIAQALRQARAQGAAVLALPELCITGYGCEDPFLSPHVHRQAWVVLRELLPETAGLAVALGLPLYFRGAVFNAACLVVDRSPVGFFCKQNLAGDGLHYEPRWFKPWPAGVVDAVELPGFPSLPVGDVCFDVGGIGLGFEVCEDAWVAQRPGARASRRGVDVIVNPSASHFAFGKAAARRRFVLEGSRAFGVAYVYANLVGNEAGRSIYDGDAMIAAGGAFLAQGPRFSYEDVRVISAVVDLDTQRQARARLASFTPELGSAAGWVRVPFAAPAAAEPVNAAPTADLGDVARGDADADDFEAFARAAPLALFDYLRKSRSRGFVVSLSGGADSAACACLVALLVRQACDELGPASFRERLSYIGLRGETPAALTAELLTTVYQSTCNSSDTTRAAARDLAAALGARHLHLDVDDLVQSYRDKVEAALGRSLRWETDDLALQNIQARARAPGVWMIANLQGALLLATSNRSEAAVGYATMDGDTAGGLAPLAGIDKPFIRGWLRWLEQSGAPLAGERWRIPALAGVNQQAPTAELRPLAVTQTDEADLMPYEVLEALEHAAIGERKDPAAALERIRALFPAHRPEDLARWVDRFYRLWSRNQWKRERFAPSFHVDDRNLDPRSWCRHPILSGGYERELRELGELEARPPS